MRRKGPTLICASCGGSFHVPPSQALRRRYCSYACRPPTRRPSRLLLPESEIARAYLAGLFDGEGCIELQRHDDADFCDFQVFIGMTDEAIMAHLSALGVVADPPRPSIGNRKPLMKWRLVRELEVVAFLESIRPYLIVKRRLADYVLSYFEAKRGWYARRGMSYRVLDDVARRVS